MSDAARWMIAFAFISLPTIAFGGYFLLSILKRQTGTENVTSEQRDYFRAGHAHAGVRAATERGRGRRVDHRFYCSAPAAARQRRPK